jgi:hypothetical protein
MKKLTQVTLFSFKFDGFGHLFCQVDMAVSTNGTMALSIKKLMAYLGQAWMGFLHNVEQLLHALFSFLLTCNFHSTGADSLFVETASPYTHH